MSFQPLHDLRPREQQLAANAECRQWLVRVMDQLPDRPRTERQAARQLLDCQNVIMHAGSLTLAGLPSKGMSGPY